MYKLTENDVAILREMVRRERGRRSNPDQRPKYVENDHQAPEVYVALTPLGGIPALLEPGLGTGTGSGNEANSADCDIYRLLPVDDALTIFDLHPVFEVTKTVYNLSESSIAGDSWVLAVRDKFGVWWAVPTATGGSTAAFTGASYTRGTNQTIGNNSSTLLVWQVSLYDTSSFVSAPSTDIVVPQAGKYSIEAQVQWDGNGTGRRVIAITSNINPGPYPIVYTQPLSASYDTIHQCIGVLDLEAGETVQIGVIQDSGGDLDVKPDNTFFNIYLLK